MKIYDLISILEEIKEEHGNLELVCRHEEGDWFYLYTPEIDTCIIKKGDYGRLNFEKYTIINPTHLLIDG